EVLACVAARSRAGPLGSRHDNRRNWPLCRLNQRKAGALKFREDVMRSAIVGLSITALAIAVFGYPAMAAKSKMGCEIGQEVWNGSTGKCEPGTPKWAGKKAGKSTAKKKP